MRNISFNNKTTYVNVIGKGSQGIVEKYTLNSDNSLVAIKKYFPNNQGDIDAATLRELNIFQKLKNCPTINQSLDIDIIINKKAIDLSIMMPFHQYNLLNIAETFTTSQKINQLPLIMNQIFNALYNLYYIGVIHTDVKPDNILVDIIDNKFKLYLADFGLAVQLPCEFSYRYVKNPLHGSPLYMAPEILTQNVYYNEKVDVWSAGITILEYITGNYITEPSDEQFIQANDVSFVAIIYKIFELIKNPLYPTKELYNQVKDGKFHDYIDVDLLLNISLDVDLYQKIPQSIISALTAMLQVNPIDRIHIKDLYNGNLCPSDTIISRGELIADTSVTVNDYYKVIFMLIKTCDNLTVNPITCYLTIDLLERYLANFPLKSDTILKKLSLYAASLLILNMKLYESIEVEFDTIVYEFNNLFTQNELMFTQLFVLKKFNYLLTACETDEFLHAINEATRKDLKIYNFQPVLKGVHMKGDLLEELKVSIINNKMIYPRLLLMYRNIQYKNLYPGDMFNFELVEYFGEI